MLPGCLRLADDVFPRVRAHAARRLVKAGWSQQRAGAAVGLSQAMVSKHLATPPAADPLVERLAMEFAAEALQPSPDPGPSPWCGTLTVATQRPGAAALVDDLLAAEAALTATPPLRVLPQVGLNIAVALPDATALQDVLAFPARLVEAHGRLLRPAPPAFGGSGHLARLLLAAKARWPLAALANVRGGPDVAAAAKRLGWAVTHVDRPTHANDEAPVLAALASARRPPQAIHDPGAVGLEPCLYVAGPDAQAVARAILRLDQTLVTQ